MSDSVERLLAIRYILHLVACSAKNEIHNRQLRAAGRDHGNFAPHPHRLHICAVAAYFQLQYHDFLQFLLLAIHMILCLCWSGHVTARSQAPPPLLIFSFTRLLRRVHHHPPLVREHLPFDFPIRSTWRSF